MKMRVLILIHVMAMAPAYLISDPSAAVLNGMHEVVLFEKGQGPEDVRAVDGLDFALQFHQRHRKEKG